MWQFTHRVRSFASIARPSAENVLLQWSICKKNCFNCNRKIVKYRIEKCNKFNRYNIRNCFDIWYMSHIKTT